MEANPSVKQVQVLHETVKGSAKFAAVTRYPTPRDQEVSDQTVADSKYMLDAS